MLWLSLASYLTPLLANDGREILRIAIIIDDLGEQWASNSRAVEFSGDLSYAFLPHAPHSPRLARRAHALGRDVMLHLPMESMTPRRLGPGGLTLDMTRAAFLRALAANIDAVPHVSGLNNHMGSLLTRHPGHMQWLMDGIRQHGNLFFVDSRTTHHTVAEQLARENGVPVMRRDVFLDDNPDPAAIEAQFRRLIDKARRQGAAVAIGHPYDSTLSVLETYIPRLGTLNIELVPVSQLLNHTPPPPTAAGEHSTDNRLVYLNQTVPHPLSPSPQPIDFTSPSNLAQ